MTNEQMDEWPKPVETFLDEAALHLRRSDVVLCRGKRSLFSRLIRWATRSHFSHTAVVFLIPKHDEGFNNTFLIESITSGVDITDLHHYAVEHADAYDVAIKRLERDWFDENVQRLVRGRMLNFIKAEYDFGTILAIARSVLRKLLFGLRTRFAGLEPTLRRTYARKGLAPAQFICSGFVQYGFLATVRALVARDRLPEPCLDEVLFKDGLTARSDTAAVLSTTPENLARSEKLTWKFVIRDGLVHPVNTAAEADRLLERPSEGTP